MRGISSARISVMSAAPFPSDRRALELLAHALQLGAQAAVERPRADLRDGAADQRGIGLRVEDDGSTGHRGDGLAQVLRLAIAQRGSRGHRGAHASDLLVDYGAVGARHLRKIADPLPIDQQAEEIHHHRRQLERGSQRIDRVVALLKRVARIAQKCSSLAAVFERRKNGLELAAVLLVPAFLEAEREERAGVTSGDAGVDHGWRAPLERRRFVTWRKYPVNALRRATRGRVTASGRAERTSRKPRKER